VAAQALRFGLVGTAGFLVNAGIVAALAGPAGPVRAQAAAFPVAASVTWWLNRRYTFGASGRSWQGEWLRYLGANALGWLANNGTYLLLVLSLPWAAGNPVAAVAAGSLAGMAFNFACSRKLVFGRR
jgi:putative flippase GtrA